MGQLFLDALQFLPGHLSYFRVAALGHQGFQVGLFLEQGVAPVADFHQLLQPGPFFSQGLEPFDIGGHFRAAHSIFNFLIAADDGIQLVKNGTHYCPWRIGLGK